MEAFPNRIVLAEQSRTGAMNEKDLTFQERVDERPGGMGKAVTVGSGNTRKARLARHGTEEGKISPCSVVEQGLIFFSLFF